MRFILGVFLIIAGILAIALPFVAGGVTVLMIGVLMIAGGLIEIIQAFGRESWGQRIAWIVLGILMVIGGAFVAAHPLLGLTFLTLTLGIYFLASGIARLFYAFKVDEGRGWLVLGGIVAVLLGVMILRQWPFSGNWAVGTLVGAYLLFDGFAVLAGEEPKGPPAPGTV